MSSINLRIFKYLLEYIKTVWYNVLTWGYFPVVDYIIPYGSFVSSIYFEIYKSCLLKEFIQ